jgi:excisionase family DNA binding protein
MSDLRDILGPDLIAAFEQLVDQRVSAALAGLETGSEPVWLTIQEAAARLRVSERTIERRIHMGRLSTSTIGRRRLIRRSDLDAVARED